MKAWTDKKEHSKLSSMLAQAQGEALQSLLEPLLRLISPVKFSSAKMFVWSLDENAHLVLQEKGQTPLLTVYWRGYAQQEIGASEARDCCAAIRTFAASGFNSDWYLVVHNRDLRNSEFRRIVNEELEALKATGRVTQADLWDRHLLLRNVFNGVLNLVRDAIRKGGLSFAQLEAIPGLDSLGLVPLRESSLLIDQYQLKKTASGQLIVADPTAILLEKGEGRLSILVGEFGSGKTTAISRLLAASVAEPIVVPGAILSEVHIRSSKELISRSFDHALLLESVQEADREMLTFLLPPVLAQLLKDKELPTVLVFDGLDESTFISRRGGFQHLFNILREVQVPVVLTLRTELWQRSQQDFATAMGYRAPADGIRNQKVRLVELLPWSEDEIGELLRRSLRLTVDPTTRANLIDLDDLLSSGRFAELFGDIPRRPLFLRFILDSVAAQGLPNGRIGRARLLYDWARRKIFRDIQAPINSGGAGRLPILDSDESSEVTVEIAFEAMAWAAAKMGNVDASSSQIGPTLELRADCPLEEVLLADRRLRRINDPLGLLLNSLLLPAPQVQSTPLRVRFAHRAFQEFFLAWQILAKPEVHSGLVMPEAVAAWMEDILAEGLIPDPSPPPKAYAYKNLEIVPPDLEIRVRSATAGTEVQLSYELIFSRSAPANLRRHRQIPGPTLVNPDLYFATLFDKIEKLRMATGSSDFPLRATEVDNELINLGRELYQSLFTPLLKGIFRQFEAWGRTLQITTDEPWIPWELIRPYSGLPDEDPSEEFLGCRYLLTRWLETSDSPPAPLVQVRRMACIEAATPPGQTQLSTALEEGSLLQDLALRHENIEDLSVPSATYENALKCLTRSGIGLIHLTGHSEFDASDPNNSGFLCCDGRRLRPIDLYGPPEIQMRTSRPLVFLNSCTAARQAISLTGLGGWVAAFVGRCGCAALIAPQWSVADHSAKLFAETFYHNLELGKTLGEASLAARNRLKSQPGHLHDWLAFTVYGHPCGKVIWG